MNLIAIPSEHCPICHSSGGQCSIMVQGVETLQAWSLKINEEDLRAEFEGRKPRNYREAYMVQQYVCLKGSGIS